MGPSSFALDNSGGVVMQQPSRSASGPQISLQGGGGAGLQPGQASLAPGGEFAGAANNAFSTGAKTLDALNKLTQGALAPIVAAEQKRLYFEGMSQVVQGRSLQEIENQQPWYTKIFGPTATVQGAQAMVAMTAISQAQNEFMESMPDLRTKDPDSVRKYLVDQAVRIGNTGDPMVDGIVQSKLAEHWGSMLDTHMKQHFAWQQEDMGNKFVNMQVASGKLLQSTLHEQSGYVDPEIMQREVSNFTDGLEKPYGMTDEAYGKYMASAARANLSNGNFEAYTALKNHGDAWNAIPMDARVQLENEEELWTQKALKKAPALADITQDQTKLSISLTQGAFPGDEAALNGVIDQMNDDWRRRSGASTDMIDNAGRQALLKQFYAGRAKVNAMFQKAQEGLADDQAQRTTALAAVNGGTSSLLPPGVSTENAQLAVEEFWKSMQGDEQSLDNGIKKLALVADEKKLRPQSLESQLRQDADSLFVTGGQVTQRAQQSLGVMQKFLASGANGPTALANYIGTESAKRVEAFIGSGVDINDPKDLESKRSWIKNGAGAATTSAEKAAAADWISKQDPGFFKRWLPIFGGPGSLTSYELNDATKSALAADLGPYVAMAKKAYPSMSDESAAQYAYNQIYGNLKNTDFVDGTVVKHNPYVAGAQSLYQGVQAISKNALDQSNEDYQWSVREVARGNLKQAVEAGIKSMNDAHMSDPLWAKASIENFRDGDFQAVGGEQGGHGTLMLYYQNTKNGQLYPVIVTPTQVRDAYLKRLNKARPEAPVREHPLDPIAGVM
ncbi:putative internal virion protein [Burkholderia phage AMP1]|uniref:Internal virion protein n=5 Tax=Ampunavirus BpAMP1 TaxID=2733589 RepID=A0A0A1I5M8_9CAUD|nr:internal virion protein [Burkholderia phage Bp-AMP1]QEP52864.1 putative internal virion protein [Burkholderia phage AMP1]CDL65194.1 hypothetical protein [Burkholderia phage Bp-AMP2]CDL65234.1 hypothetical protein [Burkholderia phage Bp-AMP3]CDL65274.1 hypothetical protein [Burkholderia phage Bp-AMP4]CDK30108.1 hypothetical protein [Burkholderia phage Bp-AMP1]